MAFFSPQTASGDVIDVNIDVNLDNFTLQDLLKLRADIDRRLGLGSFHSDLLQFQALGETLAGVAGVDGPPSNQRQGPVQGLLLI